jgi:hypothetical protein
LHDQESQAKSWPDAPAQSKSPDIHSALPAESRSFATVEMCVLLIGFSLTGAAMSDAANWRQISTAKLFLGVVVYLALGLSCCGPVMVSWRERLGRRRPVWGVGESVWFAVGLPIQAAILAALIARWLGGPLGGISFLVLFIVLPFVYLTGNPEIQWSRAPLSWSNLVGMLNIVLWLGAFLTAIHVHP